MKGYGVTGLALALLLGGVRADDKAKAVKDEWKRLNGTWEFVPAVAGGKKPPAPKSSVTFKDGKFTFKRGGEVVAEATAEVDPAATPKAIDLKVASGPEKGETLLGIYEVKGDTLRFCFASPGEPRPKTFKAKEGGHDLATYKRARARD